MPYRTPVIELFTGLSLDTCLETVNSNLVSTRIPSGFKRDALHLLSLSGLVTKPSDRDLCELLKDIKQPWCDRLLLLIDKNAEVLLQEYVQTASSKKRPQLVTQLMKCCKTDVGLRPRVLKAFYDKTEAPQYFCKNKATLFNRYFLKEDNSRWLESDIQQMWRQAPDL